MLLDNIQLLYQQRHAVLLSQSVRRVPAASDESLRVLPLQELAQRLTNALWCSGSPHFCPPWPDIGRDSCPPWDTVRDTSVSRGLNQSWLCHEQSGSRQESFGWSYSMDYITTSMNSCSRAYVLVQLLAVCVLLYGICICLLCSVYTLLVVTCNIC